MTWRMSHEAAIINTSECVRNEAKDELFNEVRILICACEMYFGIPILGAISKTILTRKLIWCMELQ
jgi:hypothetical protein